MRLRLIVVVIVTLLLMSLFILLFRIRPVESSSEETVVHNVWSYIGNSATNYNDTDPVFDTFFRSGESNVTLSPPDANGVRNLTIPKGSHYSKPVYDPISNMTTHTVLMSDAYGKRFTNDSVGDVDIISMTNDTGTYFKKDGVWHPAGEEWLGDGTLDPAGSSWLTCMVNTSVYLGNGTDGLLIGSWSLQNWLTTGFSENTVVEPASRLDGFYINATGVPFSPPYVDTIGTLVFTYAKLNIPWWQGKHVDTQCKTDQLTVTTPAFMATLFSPANLYVTDPEDKHVGAHPTKGDYVNEIDGAFYSGPGLHPQRIVIPDPLDGVYDIRIVGTSTGEYTLVVELATLEETTTHSYTGNITLGEVLISEANISEGEMTSTQPVLIPPVGGIYIPANRLSLLAPYIGLTILLAVAVVTVGYVKKRKRDRDLL